MIAPLDELNKDRELAPASRAVSRLLVAIDHHQIVGRPFGLVRLPRLAQRARATIYVALTFEPIKSLRCCRGHAVHLPAKSPP
jgi:hypothetical protein